jgi:hypothetical protein
MSLSVDSPLRGAPRVEKPEKDLSLDDLGAKIEEFKNDPHSRAPFQIERHKRYALPVAALVFGLVAFPLAIRSHRGGRSIALVGSLAILVTYYLLMTSLEGAALRTRISAAVAIWTANVVFSAVGLGLLIATAREWRWPAMPAVWRVVEALRRALPGRRAWRPRHHPTAGPRDSTHIIDRYLVREYVAFMGIGLAVASALFIVIDLVKTLDKYLRVKPPLMYILEHFAYRLPAALHDGLPIVMLVATIFLFLTLTRYHELTALKAAGGEPVPGRRAGAGGGTPGGDRRGALPGAGPAGAQRARRRGGSREDPRAGAEALAVAPAVVGAERRHPVLPRRAPEPRDQRPLRRDDPRGRPRVPADRAPRRAARALDERWLGAERGRVP